MTRDENVIEVLPPSVVEKIAAGEVVERPASVLKELVENSIDAGAARVDVAVEEAGFCMMRVADNGCGMSPGDLGRSVLPHATSKIRSAEDLYSIATMGFRGEALASVSAVSRMSVATRDGGPEGLGHEITVEGGAVGEIRPASRTRGTTVTVRDLFFNVPARKKFMKTRRGEQSAIVKTVEQLAIPFPAVHFTLTVDGKKALDLPPAAGLRERIRAVAGNEFAAGLVECEGDGSGMSALAFVSTPEKLQAKPRFQSLYVNLRRIDNDSVAFAVREAFAQYLGHRNRPSFFCFLDVDPCKVDVNVHPTKQQMKFDDERGVFSFIYHVVKEGLRKSEIGRGDLTGGNTYQGGDIPSERYGVNGNGVSQGRYNVDTGSEKSGILSDRYDNGDIIRNPYGINNIPQNQYDINKIDTKNSAGSVQTSLIFPSSTVDNPSPRPSAPPPRFPEISGHAAIPDLTDGGVSGARQPWDLIQCYQIHGIFVLAPIKNGILLIDQHAAHERVLYEQALLDVEGGRPVSQQLLFPIVLEMSPAEKAVLEGGMNYFTGLGFELADFGGQAVSISALPAFLADGEAEAAVREMVRCLLDGREAEAFREPVKRFAAAFACGAAIKSGQRLSQEEMNALINALFSTGNPYTCPHGRPTLVRISVDELTRRFLR